MPFSFHPPLISLMVFDLHLKLLVSLCDGPDTISVCMFVFFFFNFIKESFELLILCSLSPPLPLLLLPFLVYVSCLFRTDNRIILKILLLVPQKQSIKIQNREKSILDLLYFCKKKKEPKLICVLHQTAQTTSN